MKQLSKLCVILSGFFLPAFAEAVSYTESGAAILSTQPNPESANILAAAGLSNFGLPCFFLVVLMMASLYLFHIIWHPKREHEGVTESQRRAGSMRFWLAGTIVWMLISVMAEAWCLIIPLAAVFTGILIHYALHKAQLV